MNEERTTNEAGCSALSKTTEEIFKKYFFQVEKGTSTVGHSDSGTLAINTG